MVERFQRKKIVFVNQNPNVSSKDYISLCYKQITINPSLQTRGSQENVGNAGSWQIQKKISNKRLKFTNFNVLFHALPRVTYPTHKYHIFNIISTNIQHKYIPILNLIFVLFQQKCRVLQNETFFSIPIYRFEPKMLIQKH